ncbi:MAG TPA: TadE/TadG family type IV pilus assembly protein [Gaiellaceae bacterium]|jgi:Flp pilus assembly protein TadG|nr:TadE/TadG family type IV pilus assembly protein [Gaiellaceae bacterium]
MRPTLLHNEDGQAAAEMALILPLLAAILLAIAQFGIAFNNYITLTDATRAGARKAAVSRFVGDNGTSAGAAVRAAASNLKQSGPGSLSVDVNATNWTVPGSEVTVTATYPYSINILGWTIAGGYLTSTTKERLE